jgi:hypothetical protein
MNALANSRLDPAALPGVLTIDLTALRANWRLLAERPAPWSAARS